MIITKKTAASFNPTVNSGSGGLESQPPKQMLLQLQAKWREHKWIACLLVLIVLLSLIFYHLASLIPPLPLPQISSFSAFEQTLITGKQKSNDIDNFEEEDRSRLARVLREASTDDKTVIVTMMNQAYAERNSTFHVFLESFRVGNDTERLLRHVVVVCLDEKAYSRCVEVFHHRCFLLKTTKINFSGERLFMVGDYIRLKMNNNWFHY